MADVTTDDVTMDALGALFIEFIESIKTIDTVKTNSQMNAPSSIFCVRRET